MSKIPTPGERVNAIKEGLRKLADQAGAGKTPKLIFELQGRRVTDPNKIKRKNKNEWLVGLQGALDDREAKIELLEAERKNLIERVETMNGVAIEQEKKIADLKENNDEAWGKLGPATRARDEARDRIKRLEAAIVETTLKNSEDY